MEIDAGRLAGMEGQRVLGGRYQLLDELGHGGMAVVWRARDTVLGRTVAVKLLNSRHADDPESRRLIRDEARTAATLSHPNIAQVHDYGESEEDGTIQPYVVMELVRGGTLQQRLAAGTLPPRTALRVVAEVAAALAAAHAEGLVHRDIKPANVMVTPAGVKVVDFGVAAAISPSRSGARAAEIYGTPAYLAPERLTDDAVEPASDVYALGLLTYRVLSGHSPWSADTTTQMLTAHAYVEPEPLAAIAEVPGYVNELCNRCLSKDPTLRPSARDAAALLAQAAGLRIVENEPDLAALGPAIDEEPSLLIRAATTGAMTAPARPGPSPAHAADPGPNPVHAADRAGPAHAADPVEPAQPASAAVGTGTPNWPGRRNRRVALFTSAVVIAGAAGLLWQLRPDSPERPRTTGAQAANVDPAVAVSGPTPAPTVSAARPTAPSNGVGTPNQGSGLAPTPPTRRRTPPAAPAGVNLAWGRQATASSHIDTFRPAHAVDGNPATYWESANRAFPQSLTVDLGQNRSVSRLVLRLPPATVWATRTQTLSLSGSTDGGTYASVRPSAAYTFNPSSGNTATITFGATTLRYLRLTFTANTGWPAGQVSELEVFSS